MSIQDIAAILAIIEFIIRAIRRLLSLHDRRTEDAQETEKPDTPSKD